MGNATGMVILEGNQTEYTVTNLGKNLTVPKKDTSIADILEFQEVFEEFISSQSIDKVTLCEGGKDSKKLRVQLEFIVLSACVKQNIDYATYPTGSCTRVINSSYKKETGKDFQEDLKHFGLPK